MRTCGFCFLIIKQKSQVLIISSQCLPTSCALKSLKKIKRRNTCLYVQNIIFTGMIGKMNMFLLLCTMRCKIHSWWLAVAAILQNPNCHPLCNIDIFHQSWYEPSSDGMLSLLLQLWGSTRHFLMSRWTDSLQCFRRRWQNEITFSFVQLYSMMVQPN